MNAKRKNELLEKLNNFLAPFACAEMRNGMVSVKNAHPGRTDGVAEWFQCSLSNLESEIEGGFDTLDDQGNGIWSIGEGFRAARPGDLNCSDPYCYTTEQIRRWLSR